ncbi:MAG: hypothetical protein AB7S44_03105 [Spirochaetales bacterium]
MKKLVYKNVTVKDLLLAIIFMTLGILSTISVIAILDFKYFTVLLTTAFAIYSFLAAASLLFLFKLKKYVFSGITMSSMLLSLILMFLVVRLTLWPFWEVHIFEFFSMNFFTQGLIHWVNPVAFTIIYFSVEQKNVNYYNFFTAIGFVLAYLVFLLTYGAIEGSYIYPIFNSQFDISVYEYGLILLACAVLLFLIHSAFAYLKKKQQLKWQNKQN